MMQEHNITKTKTKTKKGSQSPNHLTHQKVKVTGVPNPASGHELNGISLSPTTNKTVVGLELVTPPMWEDPCVDKVNNGGCCVGHSPPGCGFLNSNSWCGWWQRHEASSPVGFCQCELGGSISRGLLLLGFPVLPHVLSGTVDGCERCQSHHPPHPMVDTRWVLQQP